MKFRYWIVVLGASITLSLNADDIAIIGGYSTNLSYQALTSDQGVATIIPTETSSGAPETLHRTFSVAINRKAKLGMRYNRMLCLGINERILGKLKNFP